MIIAIQPDDYTNPNGGKMDASSPMWAELLEKAGHRVRWIDVYRADILNQLHGCHGFMWRHGHVPNMRQVARRLLPVVERELALVVYPDQNTCWHYDDKIAQAYLLEAAGIPMPKTWIWHDAILARDWAGRAAYPLVLKLWSGTGSNNVRQIVCSEEAELWISRLFGGGVHTLADNFDKPWKWGKRRIRGAIKLLLKGIPPRPPKPRENAWELHKNYVLFQEFLPENAFDTRITVVGNRAFGFRRYNRDNDFRASGSGKIDHDPGGIDELFVRLAFEVAQKLRGQSCAIDGLWRGGRPVVSEISYTYSSWAVYECPGHWKLVDGELKWCEGHMWPEEAQIEDFLERLTQRYGR